VGVAEVGANCPFDSIPTSNLSSATGPALAVGPEVVVKVWRVTPQLWWD